MALIKKDAPINVLDMDSLRSHAINLLKQLEDGTITASKAQATVKIYDSIVDSVKVQMQYAHLKMCEPEIPFVGDCVGKSKLELFDEVKKLDVSKS